ncbi:MAG: hypothetical protein V1719_01805 [Patescibacteria group bacterium]
MSSVKNATELIKWISTKIGQIILWIEDGTRTVEELLPLKEAIQAVIDRRSFRVEFLLAKPIEKYSHPKDLATSMMSVLTFFSNKGKSTNPVEIRKAWIQLYRKWGIQYSVPEVPFGQDRIGAEGDRGRILIYLAPELATATWQALPELSRPFPAMKRSWAISGGAGGTLIKEVKNVKDLSGWLFVESMLNMPNSNTTEQQLHERFVQQNATGMTLNVYIIFGQFAKEILGEYPDISGDVRLLGSSYCGYTLSANFGCDGYLFFHLLDNLPPDDCYVGTGGRSVVVV